LQGNVNEHIKTLKTIRHPTEVNPAASVWCKHPTSDERRFLREEEKFREKPKIKNLKFRERKNF
jgi:hypothetical protein